MSIGHGGQIETDAFERIVFTGPFKLTHLAGRLFMIYETTPAGDRRLLINPMPDPSHILVVDDSPTQLRQMQMVLEKDGFSVRTAVDGNDAMKAIMAEAPASGRHRHADAGNEWVGIGCRGQSQHAIDPGDPDYQPGK